MAHIYMVFEFAKDEESAQQARHKLETWKQAFRLDKKLLYKLERAANAAADGDSKSNVQETKAGKEAQPTKGKVKASKKEAGEEEEKSKSKEDIRLLVRLGFSGHEKLTEQRWVQRIPTEEPFRDASPVIVKPGEAKFEATERQFEELA